MVNHQRTKALSGALVVLVLAALLVMAPPASASSPDDASLARDYVARINQRRAELGLQALIVLPELAAGAQVWTDHMVAVQQLAHDPDPILGPLYWDMYAENTGRGPDVDTIWQALLNSPGHYENMTNPMYTHVGVGVATGENGKQYTTHRFLHVAPEPPPDAEPLIFEDGPAPPAVVTAPPTLPPVTAPVVAQPTAPPPAPPTAPPVTAPAVTAPIVTVPSPPPAAVDPEWPEPGRVQTPIDPSSRGIVLTADHRLD